MAERGHLGYLDTFRALAIAGVVLTHSVWLVDDVPSWLDNVVHFGSKGVQLFFIVSGFTLALNYDAARLNLRSFYTKRFFRIAPMYYFSALFYVAIGMTILPNALPKNLSWYSWLATFTFTNGWHPATVNSFVPGGWSIGAEMTFYLCFPLLLHLKQKPVTLLAITIGSFLASVIAYKLIIKMVPGEAEDISTFAYFFWLVQLPAFLAGICMAAWLPKLQSFVKPARIVFPITVACMVSASLTRGFTSSYIAADLIFIALVLSGSLSGLRVLNTSAFTYVGRISFSIYLTHFLIVRMLQYVAPYAQGYMSNAVVVVFGYVIAFAGAIALSSITFVQIEMRGKALGDMLLHRRRANNAASVQI